MAPSSPAPDAGFDVSSRLVSSGLVGEALLGQARKRARETGRLLEEVLLDQNAVDEEALARFYAEEFGYPYFGFDDLTQLLGLASELEKVIPAELAFSGMLLPLAFDAEDHSLEAAVAFPTNRALLDLLHGFGPAQKVRLSVAPRSALQKAIELVYGANSAGRSAPRPLARKQRVLLVEKDERERNAWTVALEAVGHAVATADSPRMVSERLKVADYDIVVTRQGPDWREYLEATEGGMRNAEVRFASPPGESLCGEVVPYPVMSTFFFATLRAMVRVFGRSHRVPAEMILAPPRVASAVGEVLGLPARDVDEIHFASFLASIARALGEEPARFAESLENALAPPWRVRRLLEAAAQTGPEASVPMGSRVVRVVLTFLSELKRHEGKMAAAIAACREGSSSADLPVLEALLAVLYRERVAQRSSSEREVVLVEMDPHRLEMLQTALRNEGFQIRTFVNGRVAQAEIQLAPPDLLITATAVPGTDGYSLCQAAKKRLGVPTFLVANQAVDELSRVRARAVGADRFFEPPLDLGALVEAAHELLAKAEAIPKSRALRCTGALAQLGAPAILALLRTVGANALVHFWHGDKLARAQVRQGAVTSLDDPGGAKLEEVLGWTEGTFMVFHAGEDEADGGGQDESAGSKEQGALP